MVTPNKLDDFQDYFDPVEVAPYIRVVPAGVVTGADGQPHLRVTVLLTPDVQGSGAAVSGLHLQSWTCDVFRMIKAGGGKGRPWTMGLHVAKAAEGQKPPNFTTDTKVHGAATFLEDTHRRHPDLLRPEVANAIWRQTLFAPNQIKDKGNWDKLADQISATLSSGSLTTGALNSGGFDYKLKEENFGAKGQLATATKSEGNRVLDAVLAVPQADLAVCLEFQRVEELLCSLQTACDAPEERLEAERARLRRILAKIAKDELPGCQIKHSAPLSTPEKAKGIRDATPEQLEKIKADEAREIAEDRKKIAVEERAFLSDQLQPRREAAEDAYKTAAEACSTGDVPPCNIKGLALAAGEEGEAAFDEACNVHSYATWPQYKDPRDESFTNKSWSGTHPDDQERLNSDQSEALDCAQQTFFSIQSTPSVARLFGMTVDLDIPLEDLRGSGLDTDGTHYVYVSAPWAVPASAPAGKKERALPWSVAKLTIEGGQPTWFWPVAESEVTLAQKGAALSPDMPQLDGHVIMGGAVCKQGERVVRRFELTSIDIRTATELEMQRRKTRATNLLAARPSEDEIKRIASGDGEDDETCEKLIQAWIKRALWPDLAEPTSLQSLGIGLLDRGVMRKAVCTAAARDSKSDEMPGTGAVGGVRGAALVETAAFGHTRHVCLDAEDLTIGTRLDVGVPVRDETQWRPLTARVTSFGTSGDPRHKRFADTLLPHLTGGYAEPYRIGLDSALQTHPARLLPNGPANGFVQSVEAVLEEAIHLWIGAPMGIDTKAVESGRDDPSEDIFEFGRTSGLPRGFTPSGASYAYLGLLVPMLRFGLPYRFKSRCVYQGGVSVPVETQRAEDSLDGQLCIPAAPDGAGRYFRYLRQTRIDAPQILLESSVARRLNLPMGPERGATMIVRSLVASNEPKEGAKRDAIDTLKDRAQPRFTRRVILPPTLSFDEAQRHGAFDAPSAGSFQKQPEGFLPRVQLTPEGGYPVTKSTTQKGFDDLRYLVGRAIERAPGKQRPADGVELGDAVLEPGSNGDARSYPDPSAHVMAFGLRRVGRQTYLPTGDAGALTLDVRDFVGGSQRRYPDRTPVVVELKADRSTRPGGNPTLNSVLKLVPGGYKLNTGASSNTYNHLAHYLRADLPRGESYMLDFWMVPQAEELARTFSVVQSLAIYAFSAFEERSECSADGVMEGMCKLLDPQHIKILRAHYDALKKKEKPGEARTGFSGPGGHIAPAKSFILAVAKLIHEVMLTRPVSEISTVRSIELTHACNRPVRSPMLGTDVEEAPFLKPVSDLPAPLRILRVAQDRMADLAPGSRAIEFGVTDAMLDGTISLPLETMDGFEIEARAINPATSAFDSKDRGRSLAGRREGAWPRTSKDPDAPLLKARAIFGFNLEADGYVYFDRKPFTLLRAEDIAREAVASEAHIGGDTGDEAHFDLRAFWQADTGENDSWRVTQRHVFPDRKARRLEIRARSFARTAGLMKTIRHVSSGRLIEAEDLNPDATAQPEAGWTEVILPATQRPAKCDALSPEPAFRFAASNPADANGPIFWRRRRMVTTIRLGRNWFSSGEDEKLGIVLWPPTEPVTRTGTDCTKTGAAEDPLDPTKLHIPDFQDEDLGPGGRYVTRMGADPTTGLYADFEDAKSHHPMPFVHPDQCRDRWLPKGHPRKAELVKAAIMPHIAKAEDFDTLSPNQSLTVSLLCYTPHFNADAEEWEVEVDLDIGALPSAMIRFGLVRYQPHTRPELQVSQPEVQWATVTADRLIQVHLQPETLDVSIYGRCARGAKQLISDEVAKPNADWSNQQKEDYGDLVQGLNQNQSHFDAPRMRLRAFRETTTPDGLALREPLDEVELFETEATLDTDAPWKVDPRLMGLSENLDRPEQEGLRINPEHASNWTSRWEHSIPMPNALTSIDELVLYVEEINWHRPSSYPTEPMPLDKITDPAIDYFVPSGPRYADRIVFGDGDATG